MSSYPPAGRFPEDLVLGKYRVTFARSAEELDEVLRLRFTVFNLEMDEGLDSAHGTGRDEDPFDAGCHHLVVREEESGRVVGTYRMLTLEMAERHRGFYSAGEFEIGDLPREVLGASVEVGRACVAGDSRHGRALADLTRDGHLDPRHRVRPREECACLTDEAEPPAGAPISLPPLFRMYLRYGCKICGPPALDREFKTIDFFMLCDVRTMDPASRRTLSST
jgi:putative hemolysin